MAPVLTLTGLLSSLAVVAGSGGHGRRALRTSARRRPPRCGRRRGRVAGQTICLAGDYGTWQGPDKAITIRAADGARRAMKVNSARATAVHARRHHGDGGLVEAGARDSRSATHLHRHDRHRGARRRTSCSITTGTTGTPSGDGRSERQDHRLEPHGELLRRDGPGTRRSATAISTASTSARARTCIGNTFANLCDRGTNHTDNIQFQGAAPAAASRATLSRPAGCSTQGITSYDGEHRTA